MNKALSKDEPQIALTLLAETLIKRENQLEQFRNAQIPAEEDDEEDSKCPVMNAFQLAEGSSAILRMKNFTARESTKLFTKFETKINTKWKTRLGSKAFPQSERFFYGFLRLEAQLSLESLCKTLLDPN